MPLACYQTVTGIDCCQLLPVGSDVCAAAAVVAAADVVVAADVVAADAAVAASLPSRMRWFHMSGSRRAHRQEYHKKITEYIASPRH